jgi:hypothetical protein
MSNKIASFPHIRPERAFRQNEEESQTFYQYWADEKACEHEHPDLKSFLEAHPNGINNLRLVKKIIH